MLGSMSGAWLGVALCATPGPATELKYAYDTNEVIARQHNGGLEGTAACSGPVAPMTDMSDMFTFYKPDKTRSVVDRDAMTRYVARVQPTNLLGKALFDLSEDYVHSAAARRQAGQCIASHLRNWADANALLGNLDVNDPVGRRQAILVGIWTGVAAANAFAIASSGDDLPPRDVQAVRAWFARLSDEIVDEFTPPKQRRPNRLMWLDATFNQSYWAAAAVAGMAVLTQDQTKFDWAMRELRRALATVNGDGSLPHEIGRGGRVLHYHSFALEPLALLVAFADANDVRLTPAEEAALQRAARFTATGFADPKRLATKVGYPQSKTNGMGAWMEILGRHLRRTAPQLAKKLDAIAAPLRPFERDFIGINVTMMFAAKPSPP
ncbi:MAG: hypothetical protein K0S56_118 [Microvirga sp.]|jgi:hypothetical protein|nr:hypothetical protein [Microvirga sp.]